MNFDLSPDATAFRDEIRAFLAERVTPRRVAVMHETGTFHDAELVAEMGEQGWLERAVPGGANTDPIMLYLLFNELEKAGAAYDGIAITLLVAGVLEHAGTDHHRSTVLPRIYSGEALCCLGYSEPDYGSDVARITTRAVRDGDSWVIDGQKMWTTMAHVSEWVLLLTRTDPDVAPHKGLTMFLVPLDTPNIEIQPVPTMATERTNATFYDGVVIGDEWRLGDVDGGWGVMAVALSLERGVMGGTNPGVPFLRHVRRWAGEAERDGAPVAASDGYRESYARMAIANQVSTLLTMKAAWIAASGGMPGLEGSMAKVYATEKYQSGVADFARIAGPEGLLGFDADGAAADGYIDYDARHAPVTTIYGGTSEINRNNIARRHLGLGRSE